MKLTALAAIAAFANAKKFRICEDGEYARNCIPESLVGQWTERYTSRTRTIARRDRVRTRVIYDGTDDYTLEEYAALDKDSCRRTAYAFDKYCHQYGFEEDLDVEEGQVDIPKYADFRNDGVCDQDEEAANLQCQYQQCMFEYCLFRRDDWVKKCEASVAAGTDVEDRPGWGSVYSYNNMRTALGDGSFENETCEDYFYELDGGY